ncbi:TetR family transcriptional regulator [Stackebrandtia albiflava]|uniref:TetR family transcriptional regulator n=1 Tax=Stackebrandtia albiflava TaxID=406432 RepID=A0A562VAV5_9ACTN|nr:TetR/AcrR family transcriptional regulator [Stackebrandtia albiflava]TWJ14994.1 TetR family transcriptional regulator [Stackebrandtia albiflava]
MATLRTERTQESRRLLISAAAELFAQKGYRQTSIVDVAERAGISRGSIPWHFGNKLGLLEAVVDGRVDALLTEVTAPGAATGGDPLDRLTEFVRLPATRLFITLLAEAVEVGSPVRRHFARLHDALRRQVRAHIPDRTLPHGADPDALAVLLVGTVIGIHAQWRVDPDAVDLDTVGGTVRALLAGLGGPSSTHPSDTASRGAR